jgi:hypothetical protein
LGCHCFRFISSQERHYEDKRDHGYRRKLFASVNMLSTV